jgi:16S rRNA (guanine527-N7)-methyltransferase
LTITSEIIEAALESWALPVPGEEAVQRLVHYAELLQLWNSKVNLTAIRNEAGILHRHLMEGAFAASLVPRGAQTVLDFGSGSGIPGIPIAICRPELKVALAESSGKKAAFLREVARQLAIPIDVYSKRVGRPLSQTGFDLVTMRAVDRFDAMISVALLQLAPRGRLMLLVSAKQDQKVRDSVRAEVSAEVSWERHVFPAEWPGILLLGKPLGVFHVEHSR